jgi:phytoene dehydrogenase-like protein
MSNTDAVVVGGGLSGLAAATYLARGGRSVTLFERAHALGGRAQTHEHAGYALNLGPHALYAGGAAVPLLRELGVSWSGALPATSGLLAVAGGSLHRLPGGFLSLLSTDLLGFAGKIEAARALATISRVDAGALGGVSLRTWIDGFASRPEVRRVLEALFRVSTYANAPDLMSAGAAIPQVQMALGSGVYYLDGGWQSLVVGLADSARAAGVRIVCDAHVTAVTHGAEVEGVALANGEKIATRDVVLAGTPGMVRALTRSESLRGPLFAVRAACLDLALTALPFPKRRFALGIDQPLYYSLHSATAKVAPSGCATIHVAKYLDPQAEADPKGDELELEELLDRVQPGWRDAVAYRRYLPAMTASSAVVLASAGGKRPSPVVADVRGLYAVGDWVGDGPMLADAALASARTAAQAILAPSDERRGAGGMLKAS